MRLAIAWGCSIKEVEETVTSRELTEWKVAERIGLFPDPWDLQSQLLCYTAAGGVTKKNKKPWTREDFLPEYLKPKRSLADQLAQFDAQAGIKK